MDHSSSNGHLPGLPIKSSGDKKSLVLLVLTTLILVIGSLNYLQLQQLRIVYETVLNEPDEGMISEAQSLKPRVWIQGKRVGIHFLQIFSLRNFYLYNPRLLFSLFFYLQLEAGYLVHVFEMFEKLGYQIVNGTEGEAWDVLWSHEYPFTRGILETDLEPHQRVSVILDYLSNY